MVKPVLTSLIFILVLSAGLVYGQTRASGKRKPAPTSKTKSVRPRPVRTISMGVLNGKAIYLDRPTYPQTARAVGAYGQVPVQVLIDQWGKVIAASAVKGHLLLHPAAVKSALASLFQPVIIGGEPIRVTGVINYNFTPMRWNWLEVGFALKDGSSYYSLKLVPALLPSGFADVSELIDQSTRLGTGTKGHLDASVAMIRGRLLDDRRSGWLFEVGLLLAHVKANCCRMDDELVSRLDDLKVLCDSAPAETPQALVDGMREIIRVAEDKPADGRGTGRSFYDSLISMEDRFQFTGR